MKNLITFIGKLALRYKEDRVSAMSAELTYYVLLSVFPFIICILEIVRIMNITNTELFYNLTDFIPKSVLTFIEFIFLDIKTKTSDGILPFAIIISLWSASRGINSLIQSLNYSNRIKESQNFFMLRIFSFIYTIAFILVLFITGTLIIYGNKIYQVILSYVSLPGYFSWFVVLFQYLFSILLSILFFTGLYNITPKKKNGFKAVLPGTLFATFGWIGLSGIFSIYVNYSTSLSYMYGSLANIIIVMLWLYICSTIIILGSEINALLWEQKDA